MYELGLLNFGEKNDIEMFLYIAMLKDKLWHL